MKKLSFGYKIIYIINIVFAVLLALSYLSSYISPKTFSILALVNFGIPLLWVVNLGFALLWILKLKKYFVLSLLVLALGWFQLKNLFVFSNSNKDSNQTFSVMSYNVMQFFSKNDAKATTINSIKTFIKDENPNIICLQEFKNTEINQLKNYRYKAFDVNKTVLQSAIFSRYEIVNSKHFDFKNSGNSAIFADIVINTDTVRIFSTHFQSLNLKPDLKTIQEEPKERLVKRLEQVFKQQLNQFSLIENDIKNSPYPVVFCTDLNNTALSYLYRRLINLNLKDSFLESGQFYGNTYNFGVFPVRIDMILISDKLESTSFKNYKVDYSDHYPVMAKIAL